MIGSNDFNYMTSTKAGLGSRVGRIWFEIRELQTEKSNEYNVTQFQVAN